LLSYIVLSLEAAVAISLLILAHEFGHFVCAKAVGMRVEVFSIGFWKRLVGVKIGDTDYRVSLVPLGGYVKVTGEAPEEGQGKPYEFWSKSPGQRALFVIGGVTMNVLLALVLFIAAFSIGVPFTPPVVGEVEQGSPAWKAGLMRGDRVLNVNGEEADVFDDIFRAVALGSGEQLRFRVRRGEELLNITVEPAYEQSLGRRAIGVLPHFQAVVTGLARVGGPEGPSPAREAGIELGDRILAINGVPTPTAGDVSRQMLLYPHDEVDVRLARDDEELTVRVRTHPAQQFMLGISGVTTTVEDLQPGGPAQQAGLRPGDRIEAVNGRSVPSYVELEKALLAARGRAELRVSRDEQDRTLSVEVSDAIAANDFLSSVSFQSSGVLTWVQEDGPAYKAGMRPGDVIVSMAGREVTSWADVLAAGRKAGHDPRKVVWTRDGQTLSATVAPALADAGGGGVMGVVMDWPIMEPRKYGPISAITHGFSDFKDTVGNILLSLRGIATRDVSSRNLGGLITIARLSYRAAEFGIGKLLQMTAVLSASIAFLNILPVPVLDGGHLLFLAIEKLRGRRLSERVMTVAQTIGFVLLLLLVVYVTRNDIVNLIGGAG